MIEFKEKSKPFQLSAEGIQFVKAELERYEARESAIIPSLYRAQQENGGWISREVIRHLGEIMEIPEARIDEVSKFYTMFNQKPVGRYHVQVCCNISCAMNGGRELLGQLCSSFEVPPDQVTADGKFTFTRVECLGSCDTAPMMQVNDRYYENLTPDMAVQLLKRME